MAKKFTFDADVVIGLDNIAHLDDVLELLIKNEDHIYMSEENLSEIHYNARTKIKKVAKKTIKGDCEDFQKFRETLADKGIILSGKDKYVPFVAELTKSDYIVTFDTILTRKANDYRAAFNCDYMAPISAIGLLKYLYESKLLNYLKYMKIGLKYFKYEELTNIHQGIIKQNWDVHTIRERFQLYKDPIIESFKKIYEKPQKRIDTGWPAY